MRRKLQAMRYILSETAITETDKQGHMEGLDQMKSAITYTPLASLFWTWKSTGRIEFSHKKVYRVPSARVHRTTQYENFDFETEV